MTQAKLTSKGQLTLPKPIREYLNIESGDMVEFIIDDEGNVIMSAKTVDIDDVFGMMPQDKVASVSDMKKAIKKQIRKKTWEKMKAIDTNVLVRLIVNDDEIQAKKALHYVKKHREVFISQIVLCEAAWVFSACYDFTKTDLATTIEHILKTEQFIIESSETIWSALLEFKRTKLDFTDCLIGATAKHQNKEPVATFDKKATRSFLFDLLD